VQWWFLGAAEECQRIKPRGTEGDVAASVVDPFGSVLGATCNSQCLNVPESTKPA
jgi:hypothetical protein